MDMRRLVGSVWQRAVKHWELRPGSVTEWFVGQIMEELMRLMESAPQKVYVQETTVKAVVQKFKTIVVSGTGKDAITKDIPDGWWITFTDSLSAVLCQTEPVCKPGDTAVCTWEFKPSGK